jgi:hypothetical protein
MWNIPVFEFRANKQQEISKLGAVDDVERLR